MAKVAAPLVVTSVGATPSSTNDGTWMPVAAMNPQAAPSHEWHAVHRESVASPSESGPRCPSPPPALPPIPRPPAARRRAPGTMTSASAEALASAAGVGVGVGDADASRSDPASSQRGFPWGAESRSGRTDGSPGMSLGNGVAA